MPLTIEHLQKQLEERIAQIAEMVHKSQSGHIISQHIIQNSFWETLELSRLIDAPPGIGKTYSTAKLVDRLWEDHKIPSIVFGLSYDALADRERISSTVPTMWKGRSRMCNRLEELNPYYKKGYPAPRCKGCDCGYYTQFDSTGPVVTPIENFRADPASYLYSYLKRSIDPDPPEFQVYSQDLKYAHRQVLDFGLRIVDEFDPSRMVKKITVSKPDLVKLRDSSEYENIASLMSGLLTLVDAANNKTVPLDYEQLRNELAGDLDGFLPDHIDNNRFQKQPTRRTIVSVAPNVLPYLLPILSWELQSVGQGRKFNRRIHITEQNNVEIRFRLPYADVGPTVYLDASAEPALMRKVFHLTPNIDLGQGMNIAELPDSVEVYQHSEHDFSRSTVGLYRYDTGLGSRLYHYKQIEDDLEGIPYSKLIGVVTFSEIEQELKDFLVGAGYQNVETAHYGNIRSINTMEKVDVLILFGTVRPNPDDLLLKTKAMFFDESEIDPEYDKHAVDHVSTKWGYTVRLESGRYTEDDRIQAMHKQASTWEMYQAFHRARPLLRDKETPLKVFVYSALPIPGATVSRFLGRYGEIAEILRNELEQNPEIRSSKLAGLGLKDNAKLNTEQRYILRAGARIAELAGARWDATTRKFKS